MGAVMNVIEYVTEEVTRQGHDVLKLDGIERVSWMLDAWAYAIRHSWWRNPQPSLDDIIILGKMIEPSRNQGGIRTVGVRVGHRICPPPAVVWEMLKDLIRDLNRESNFLPLDFYREFELIHPFVDGNGRVGKVLLNWLNGTLLQPIFPPGDFWDEPIANP